MSLPSIQSYEDLKNVVQSWINRKDQRTLDNIPLFINMAEKEIYRDLKIREFIVTSTVLVSSDSEILAPTDAVKYRNVFVRTKEGIKVLTRQSLADINNSESGFAITDRFMFFTPDLKEGELVYIEYYKEQPLLKKDSDVNTLLTIAPDLIIYGALEIAARWSNDNDEVSKWSSLRQQAMGSLENKDADKEYSGGAMIINSGSSYIYGGHYGYI